VSAQASSSAPTGTTTEALAEPVRLLLEDGTVLDGQSFGAVRPVFGEVVFNTGMAGYVETLTDPSYRGQILVCTYPLIGNYGVPDPRAKGSIDMPYESDRVQVQGLVVQNYVPDHSHRAGQRSLGSWLQTESIPGFTGADTRTLTRRLREHGTMPGWLFPTALPLAEAKRAAEAVDMKDDVFRLVAPAEARSYGDGTPKVLLVDVGAKDNMVRSLLGRGASVRRIPWHEDLVKEAATADGIVIGNGPGDPRDLASLVEQIRTLLASYRKPVFGICLGHQLLSMAAGYSIYKLPYGHRSVNQPVQDLLTRRSYITSQNHGYAVDASSSEADWEPWFVNINDGTNEGIRSRHRPFMSVQFHPEARPGPKDSDYLFDDFIRAVGGTFAG